jgi:hypothetical protein
VPTLVDGGAGAAAAASSSGGGGDSRDDNAANDKKVGTAVVAALVAFSLCIFPGHPPEARAGFGAPTGAVSSPPLPGDQLEFILGMDRKAAIRRTNIIRTEDFDILLQELNALILLDQEALETDDAWIALQAATNLANNMKDAVDKVGASSSSVSAKENFQRSQRQRLLETRRLQVGLSLPGVVRLVTWTTLAVIN